VTLEGRTAVVTGAGRGIGAAIAAALAREGAHVIVSARSRDAIEAVAAEIVADGGDAVALPCDVTDEAAVEALARGARAEAGRVQILVNNAGAASSAPLHALTLDEWNRLFAVNITGTFLCTRAFVPEMVAQGAGRVINVASVSGLVGARYVSAYTAAKHAVVGFTRAIGAEVARSGVTVNAVCPGYVDTPMTRHTIENIAEKTGRSRDEAERAVRAMAGHGRLVTPDEVADAVLWLAGDGAASVNGQAIVIDGGGFRG
jgi:3-hydroxybutyrate dehydrogenase